MQSGIEVAVFSRQGAAVFGEMQSFLAKVLSFYVRVQSFLRRVQSILMRLHSLLVRTQCLFVWCCLFLFGADFSRNLQSFCVRVKSFLA